ncbi:MAG: peptidoglycan DD-metalloendopeptidase family protein [Nitrospirota bacterium]
MSVNPVNTAASAGRQDPRTDDAKLKKASRELESFFYLEMLKAMREGTGKDGLFSGGEEEDIVNGMFDEQISTLMASSENSPHFLFESIKSSGAAKGQSTTSVESVAPKINEAMAAYAGTAAAAVADAPAETDPTAVSGPAALVEQGRVSSPYGMRKDPIAGGMKMHRGVDIAAPSGSRIFAAGDGTVTFSGQRKGYGNLVVIKHSGGLTSLYAHNSTNIVNKGDTVKKGDTVALVGQTGRATGPHLHFEVRKGDHDVDPETLTAGNVNFSKVF